MSKRMGIEAQGDFAENSRKAQLTKENASPVNLNELTDRKNFPMVDLASKKGFESVKGFASAQAAVDHLCDLQAPVEWATSKMSYMRERTAKAIQGAAQKLQERGAWPDGIDPKADVATLKTVLAEKTKVAVPSDLVPETHAKIAAEVPESPSAWGVDPNSANLVKAIGERIAVLQARIVSCGKTCAQLIEHAQQSIQDLGGTRQPEANAISNLERLATPRPEPAPSPLPGAEVRPAPRLGPSPVAPAPKIGPSPVAPASPTAPLNITSNPNPFGPQGGSPK